MLASVVLRLLGSRVVHGDTDLSNPSSRFFVKRETWSTIESSSTVDLGESLFNRLLLVLHALLSSCQPYWLRPKSLSKSTPESSRESTSYDREVAESLQIDPWTVLEDRAGPGLSSINAAAIARSDHVNMKASSWLKGAVRVGRMDLTYIGAIDDDN
ncbi:hypothetical protein Tco_0846353 [Tanacetum coccineum]